MIVSFHPEAEAEFVAAIDYYETCRLGLGRALAYEARSTIGRILKYPLAWPAIEGEIRRARTSRFPFAVLYVEMDDGILVLAVMHMRRNPENWKDRLRATE